MGLSNELSVNLGVSPAAASTPTGVFSQRFEALFPHTEALGYVVSLTAQLFLLVYLCTNVGTHGPPATAFPRAFSIHPGCLSLPLLPVWMNVSSLSRWLLDFRVVRLSGTSCWILFLNLLWFLFWLSEEAQCIHLCLLLESFIRTLRGPDFLIFIIST